MEALSLLKYWRASPAANVRNNSTTTVAAASTLQPAETDDEEDEGPFFDLEFAVPDDDEDDDADDGDEGGDEEDEVVEGSEETDGDREFDLADSSEGRSDPSLTLSPSDDLFFKGKLVPLESSSFNPSPESNTKTPQFPVSFLKSATKFRIFLLGFKKPKPPATEPMGTTGPPKQQQQQSKLFAVKFKVEDAPIVSLFTRDGSSRSSATKIQRAQRTQLLQQDDVVSDDGVSSSDAKRFTKDVVHKYLKRIKPLYVKVSRKYGEKLRFSGQLSLGSAKTHAGLMSGVVASAAGNSEGTPTGVVDGETEPVPPQPAAIATSPVPPPAAAAAAAATSNTSRNQKQGNLPAGMRVVCKHLGKSRSASAAVAAVAPTPLQAQRRDDSLFQQQDGIQSAIAHCKKSFNASKEKEGLSLPRCVSDASAEKSGDTYLRSSGKGKEACI